MRRDGGTIKHHPYLKVTKKSKSKMNKLEKLLALQAKLQAETATTFEVIKFTLDGKNAEVLSSKGTKKVWSTKWLTEQLANGNAVANKDGVITFKETARDYEWAE